MAGRASHLEKIFDEFYQVDQSGENTTPGTGLGLATCKRLVELLEGEIKAESIPGRGTTFSVRLPQETFFGDSPVRLSPIRMRYSPCESLCW